MPEGDDGGGAPPAAGTDTPDWRDYAPEDLRSDPSLQKYKTVSDLVKGAHDAQKLIGTKRMEIPQPNWTDEQWAGAYAAMGRPEAPDKYKVPEIEMPEGVGPSEEKIAKFRENAHKLGLSDKQFQGVLEHYFEETKNDVASVNDQRTLSQKEATEKLREEFGDDYEAKLDVAKSFLKKFDSDGFASYLEESGLGNDPRAIRMFVKAGEAIMEDRAPGKGHGLDVTDSTRAHSEIKSLQLDQDFMGALTQRDNPAHDVALAKWEELHRLAHGTDPIPAS